MTVTVVIAADRADDLRQFATEAADAPEGIDFTIRDGKAYARIAERHLGEVQDLGGQRCD